MLATLKILIIGTVGAWLLTHIIRWLYYAVAVRILMWKVKRNFKKHEQEDYDREKMDPGTGDDA